MCSHVSYDTTGFEVSELIKNTKIYLCNKIFYFQIKKIIRYTSMAVILQKWFLVEANLKEYFA